MIPKPRFDEALAKSREKDARILELEAKIAANAQAPAGTPRAAAPPTAPATPPNDSQDRIAKLELQQDHGLSREQASKVLELQHGTNLSVERAIALAKMENPKLFGGEDRRGFNPATHSASPPGTEVPPPEPTKTKADEIREVRKSDRWKASAMAKEEARERIKAKIPGRQKAS